MVHWIFIPVAFAFGYFFGYCVSLLARKAKKDKAKVGEDKKGGGFEPPP